MTTLWSRDREIQEIARKVPDPLSRKAGSGNETKACANSQGVLVLEVLYWYKDHQCLLVKDACI